MSTGRLAYRTRSRRSLARWLARRRPLERHIVGTPRLAYILGVLPEPVNVARQLPARFQTPRFIHAVPIVRDNPAREFEQTPELVPPLAEWDSPNWPVPQMDEAVSAAPEPSVVDVVDVVEGSALAAPDVPPAIDEPAERVALLGDLPALRELLQRVQPFQPRATTLPPPSQPLRRVMPPAPPVAPKVPSDPTTLPSVAPRTPPDVKSGGDAVLAAATGSQWEPVEDSPNVLDNADDLLQPEADATSVPEPSSAAPSVTPRPQSLHPADVGDNLVESHEESARPESDDELPLPRQAVPVPVPDPPTVKPDESAPRAATPTGALFEARGQDRSPATWLERLTRAARQEHGGAPEQLGASLAEPVRRVPSIVRPAPPGSVPSQAPLPVPQAVRRFVRPLVGIDPATVRVHRGGAADIVADRWNADALAVGDEVVIGGGQSIETPEGLGLLAHELTHVARQRNPLFVPPIVRRESEGAYPLNEEHLARRIEQRVTRLARQAEGETEPGTSWNAPRIREAPRGNDQIGPPPSSLRRMQPAAPSAAWAVPGAAATTVDPLASLTTDWNGLPAPWEPLPEWDTTPTPSSRATVTGQPQVNSVAAPSQPAVPANGAVVQRAEPGRSSAEPSTAEPPPSPPAGQPPVAPDLDMLAQQVYAILRRRLAAEQRRAG